MNLEPETRRDYYISSEMKKIWSVEIELLNKLLEVCKKHNLRIWAEGGTLLGAVREHGYIPWDDDIDMAMPREDYDKLQAVAKDEFKSPYFFQSGYTDMFPNGMAKIRMDGTSAIERKNIFKNLHQGIFIDIFPLDIIPDNTEELNLFIKKISVLRGEIYKYCDHTFSFTDWKYDLRLLKIIIKIKFKGFNKCFKEFEEYVKHYNSSQNTNVSLVSWSYNERFVRNRHWYDGIIWLPFEDVELPVPKDYHKILEKQYGNYMEPKQIPALHHIEFLSTDTSYLSVLQKLRKDYSKERWSLRKNSLLKKMKKVKHLFKNL